MINCFKVPVQFLPWEKTFNLEHLGFIGNVDILNYLASRNQNSHHRLICRAEKYGYIPFKVNNNNRYHGRNGLNHTALK